MDDEADLDSGRIQQEKKRSYNDLMMHEEELEEPDSDLEEFNTTRLYKDPKGFLNKKMQRSGNSGGETEIYGTESSGFLPVYPVCMPQDRWGIRGRAEASPSSILEYWVYLDNQNNMAHCPVTTAITPPATPVTHRPYPSTPVPRSVTASTASSVVSPMVSGPVTATCSPISSVCSPTTSAWDTLSSTSRSPGCSDQDPVSAAAHLHLLGEALSLIGHHLQETNKIVSLPSSLSLLLDSLLCALAPLICLTAEIPELRSCTQHTLASTLENISYVMPGM
ncbi:uncharacterized protein hmgxb4b isoform 1-T2 [Symphorus nematophorus]